jgi:hypothetical protein
MPLPHISGSEPSELKMRMVKSVLPTGGRAKMTCVGELRVRCGLLVAGAVRRECRHCEGCWPHPIAADAEVAVADGHSLLRRDYWLAGVPVVHLQAPGSCIGGSPEIVALTRRRRPMSRGSPG